MTGGATGVGAALLKLLAELGAPEVTVLDVKEPSGPHKTFLQTDLSEHEAVDAATRQIQGPLTLYSTTLGWPTWLPPSTVFRVSVLAPIHLTNALMPHLNEGGAVVVTSSIDGMAWPRRLEVIQELLSLGSWDAMFDWFDGRVLGVDTYSF